MPAVSNASTGKITVSGTARITSANEQTTGANRGTIFLSNKTGLQLQMTGGTVENTSTGDGYAIYSDANSDKGIVATITGGTVTKAGTTSANSLAIRAYQSGTITVGNGVTITGGMTNVP